MNLNRALTCFREEFSDTVFSVNNESNSFPWHTTYTRGLWGSRISMSNSAEFSRVACIFEVSRFIFFYYLYNDLQHKFILDKAIDKKVEMDIENTLKNDICGRPNFDLNMYGCTEGKFYPQISAAVLIKQQKSMTLSEQKCKILKRNKNLKNWKTA
jgi:hypothetical protein